MLYFETYYGGATDIKMQFTSSEGQPFPTEANIRLMLHMFKSFICILLKDKSYPNVPI